MSVLLSLLTFLAAASCTLSFTPQPWVLQATPSACHISSDVRASTAIYQSSPTLSSSVAPIETSLQNGLTKMNQLMTAEFFLKSPNLKKLYTQCTKSITVKQSSIPNAGKGLFATKNIKAGSIISFYPAHALGVELQLQIQDQQQQQQLWVSSNEEDATYFAQNPPGGSSYLHATDQPIFNRPSLLDTLVATPILPKDSPIYLDANPNRQVDPLWVSHYINDGAIISSNDEIGVTKYYQQSKRNKNCIHVPLGPSPVMATVATRKIKKGEELFKSYGCVYWLGVLYPSDGDGDVNINRQIQQQIKESAQDLFASMKSVNAVYANQIEAVQAAYNEL